MDVGTRRAFLYGTVTTAVAVAGCSSSADEDETRTYVENEPDYDGWLEDVPSYEGTVDRTGETEVVVRVGTGDLGYQYDPAAVRVERGTTVVWEWTGRGGPHDVVETGGEFESDNLTAAGETFAYTFDERGVYTYVCIPHVDVDMKGAVEVV